MANKKDFATSTVLTAPSPADSGSTLVVQAGHGARFPATPFYVTVHPPAEFPTLDNAEKLLVSNKSTDTFTITRGEGDTSPLSIEAGWRISNSLYLDDTADTFDDLTDGTTNKAYTGTEKTKLAGIEAGAEVTSTAKVDTAGATMNADTTLAGNGYFLDQDDMSSNSDTKVPSQQSVKAYIDAAITAAKSALMPVGTVVTLGVATNPATLYGFGTWTAITGRTVVGKAASGTFGTLDATGGAETHTLSMTEIPNATGNVVAHSSRSAWWSPSGVFGGSGMQSHYVVPDGATGGAGSVQNWGFNLGGGGGAHNNLQPYIVKYMWQRTA